MFSVCLVILAILLCELDRDQLATDVELGGLAHVGIGGLVRVQELDEGEAFDSAEVGRLFVLILGDVDVAHHAIFLEDEAEFIHGDVTRKIARDDRLDVVRVEEQGAGASLFHWNDRFVIRGLINLKVHALLGDATVEAIHLFLHAGQDGCALAIRHVVIVFAFLFHRAAHISPGDLASSKGAHDRILERNRTEFGVELLEVSHGYGESRVSILSKKKESIFLDF